MQEPEAAGTNASNSSFECFRDLPVRSRFWEILHASSDERHSIRAPAVANQGRLALEAGVLQLLDNLAVLGEALAAQLGPVDYTDA